MYLGYRRENTPRSASVVTMFLMGTRLTVFWTPSPRPFLAEDVIKEGQERRAKFKLARRSDCLVCQAEVQR